MHFRQDPARVSMQAAERTGDCLWTERHAYPYPNRASTSPQRPIRKEIRENNISLPGGAAALLSIFYISARLAEEEE